MELIPVNIVQNHGVDFLNTLVGGDSDQMSLRFKVTLEGVSLLVK
jgi:hypothetical protein